MWIKFIWLGPESSVVRSLFYDASAAQIIHDRQMVEREGFGRTRSRLEVLIILAFA
jgi:hypothetical protein